MALVGRHMLKAKHIRRPVAIVFSLPLMTGGLTICLQPQQQEVVYNRCSEWQLALYN